MHAISLLPGDLRTARLTAALSGSEWFEFEAELAPEMNLRLKPDGRTFPSKGTVSLRRGPDHAESGERIVDAFRYIESCVTADTGEHVDERFGVTLFMDEAAFDRLLQRPDWGLPELELFFDGPSRVITSDPGRGGGGLWFHADVRSWESISGASLVQRPARR